jgi:hypothetical protein
LRPLTPTYKLFISHAWDYKDEYEGVVRLLNGDITFRWENLSIPFNEPIATPPLLSKSYRHILRQIEEKIKQSDCMVVLAAMYVNHRGWIQSEIEAARDFGKPIVAVRPRGQERVPEVFNWLGVHGPVGWTTDSVISAIRAYASPRGTLPAPKIANLRPLESPEPLSMVPIGNATSLGNPPSSPLSNFSRLAQLTQESPYGSIPFGGADSPPSGNLTNLNILLDLYGKSGKK